jgi:hypothetical protein
MLYAGLMLAVATYAFGYSLEQLSVNLEEMLWFVRIEYLGNRSSKRLTRVCTSPKTLAETASKPPYNNLFVCLRCFAPQTHE